MKTAVKLGPADHGRPLTLDDFEHSAWEEGYRYELIDGRLYVAPAPDLPEDTVAEWAHRRLIRYSDARPDILGYLTTKARVIIPGRTDVTNPEPDITAYKDFPATNRRDWDWQDVHPILVVEVVSPGDIAKDLVRNVELYLAVPSIKEYWVFDYRDSEDHPFLMVHRRRGKRWVISTYRRGEKYTTKLLPGFTLLLDHQP